jgi:hypothetical protein
MTGSSSYIESPNSSDRFRSLNRRELFGPYGVHAPLLLSSCYGSRHAYKRRYSAVHDQDAARGEVQTAYASTPNEPARFHDVTGAPHVSKNREDRLSPPLSVNIRTGLTQWLENPRPVPFDLFYRYDSLLHGQAKADHGTEDDHKRMDSDWIMIHLKVPFRSPGAGSIVAPAHERSIGGCPPRSPASGLFYGQLTHFNVGLTAMMRGRVGAPETLICAKRRLAGWTV